MPELKTTVDVSRIPSSSLLVTHPHPKDVDRANQIVLDVWDHINAGCRGRLNLRDRWGEDPALGAVIAANAALRGLFWQIDMHPTTEPLAHHVTYTLTRLPAPESADVSRVPTDWGETASTPAPRVPMPIVQHLVDRVAAHIAAGKRDASDLVVLDQIQFVPTMGAYQFDEGAAVLAVNAALASTPWRVEAVPFWERKGAEGQWRVIRAAPQNPRPQRRSLLRPSVTRR